MMAPWRWNKSMLDAIDSKEGKAEADTYSGCWHIYANIWFQMTVSQTTKFYCIVQQYGIIISA